MQLDSVRDLSNAILSIWGILALVGGPILFFKARKYFPERKEAITPEQLTTALEKLSFDVREAVGVSISRVQTSFESQHAQLRIDLSELKESMVEAHRKAAVAHEEAVNARHQSDLTKSEMTGLEKLMSERMDHLATLIKGQTR